MARLLPQYDFAIARKGLWGWLILASGFALVFSAKSALSRHRTTGQPGRNDLSKARALVTTGIYKYTRNPIYLGMAMMLLAWMIFLHNWMSAAGIALFVWFVSKYQIRPEEDALARTFGEEYTRYKKRVRRWV